MFKDLLETVKNIDPQTIVVFCTALFIGVVIIYFLLHKTRYFVNFKEKYTRKSKLAENPKEQEATKQQQQQQLPQQQLPQQQSSSIRRVHRL